MSMRSVLDRLTGPSTKRGLGKPLSLERREEYQQNYKRYLHSLRSRVEERLEHCDCPSENIHDFKIEGKLGIGRYGIVVLGKHKLSNKLYAIRVQRKRAVSKAHRTDDVFREKVIQYAVASKFVVALKFTSSDDAHLYMIVEHSPYGDFARCFLCNKQWEASEDQVKLHAAQIVLGLEFLHDNQIALRDLKPTSCIVFPNGYLKIGNFGLATTARNDHFTFCGTEPYIAPEVYENKGYRKAVDWYALGVMVQEALYDCNQQFVAKKEQISEAEAGILIKRRAFNRPISIEAATFLDKIKKRSPSDRLGNLDGKADDVKLHPWFSNVNFKVLLRREYRIDIPCDPMVVEEWNGMEMGADDDKSTFVGF